MKVLVSALFAVAVAIPPALADKREDAYAGVERRSEAFSARLSSTARTTSWCRPSITTSFSRS